MANPYSLIHNYNQVPLYNHQFDLLATALPAKEQGLAQGRDKVDQVVDQMENLDLYKDVDKEYAKERLSEILAYTDKYSNMDLSNPDLVNSIAKNYKQVLDENVVNAIASTTLFKAEQAGWEEKKNKEPKLYSEGNRRYAMQFSDQWRNSDKVGEVYRGGGGFREFIDVEGYMTENLPKIAKDLGLEYVELGPGNGIFRETITKKEVSRDRVRQALQGALNPKMKEQLQINAWNTYDNIPEEVVQAAYNQEYEKDLNFYQDQKSKYEALRNTTTDPNQREIYNQAIEQIEQGITGLNQNSYERVGKVGAYNSLYMKEWESNYLDAYSHAPVEVKREVNALDEATANYQMKVAEFELSQSKFSYQQEQDAIKNDLAQQKIEIQKANLALKAQGKKPDGATAAGVKTFTNAFDEALSVIENSPVEDKEGESSISEVEWIQNKEREAYNKFRNMFGEKISQEDMNSPELIAALKKGGNGQDKQIVTLKSGKKVTFDLTNPYVSTVVTNYANSVLDDAPVQKKAYATVSDQANKIMNKLVNTAKTDGFGGTQDALPILKYKIVGTEDNFKIVPVDFKKAGREDFNNYESLLYKKGAGKKLTWAEEKTLDLYVKTSMYNSSSTSSDAKAIIKKTIEKDYLWKSKSKKSFTDWNSAIYVDRSITPGNASKEDVENQWKNRDLNVFTSRDVSSNTGVNQDLEALSKNIETEFKNARGTTNYNQTKQVIVIDKKENPKTWSKVEEIFPGKLEKDYEVNIVPITWPNGMPKGESKLIVTDKDGNEVEKGNINLSSEQLKALTGREQQIRRDAFDASFGEFAQTITLGSASLESVLDADKENNTNRYKRLQTAMYQSPSGAVVPYLSADFKAQITKDFEDRYGLGSFAFNKTTELEQGKYDFKLEPIGETYTIGVYKEGKRVYAKDMGLKSLNIAEVTEIKNKSQVLSRQAFLDYMQAEALKTSVTTPQQ